MSSDTPVNVAALARADATIPLDRTVLLGTVLRVDGPLALIRIANGDVHKLTLGDTLNGGEIVAIDETRVIFARQGDSWTLDLPGR